MSKLQYQQKPLTSDTQTLTKPQYQNKRYQNNNNYRKTKYQDKTNRYTNKHGFDYDQNKISYNTEIPQMPEKLKIKPDQNKLNKKLEDLENKVKQLKKLRKQKKDNYKNGSKIFTDQIETQKHYISLAKACLVVLNFDKNNLDKDIDDVENKINQHKKKIDFINRPNPKTTKTNKIQEMNYQELVKEEERITHQMSIKNLTKAEEVQFSNKLNKIKKRKVQIPKQKVSVHQSDQKYDEIQSHKNAIQKLRHIRETLADKSTDIDNKIESIEEDIQDFEDKIEQIHDKLRNTDNSKLLQEAAEIKQQIWAIWDQVQQLKDQHNVKLNEYEQQQQKIKYIEWAKQVKAKKAQAWQAEKQQRKKQKLREKEKQKKGDQKPTKQGDKKQGQKTQQEKPAFQRKRFNKNQKQIDACAFLIQYCKDLSSGDDKKAGQSTAQNEVKLQQALKKGEWAKMKNVEVIQSKKKRIEEEPEQKTFKKKESKIANQEPTDRFSHTYFVAQVFDSVKVLPPTKSEDLEKVINELQDKMEYYIAHPEEEVGKALLPAKESERETKGKVARRIINTEEFPSLR